MLNECKWMLRTARAGVARLPEAWMYTAIAWRRYWRSYRDFNRFAPEGAKVEIEFLDPQIFDATATTPIEPIYFYQNAWAFERILARRPELHVDVGSHHTFVAFLSKITDVTMVDIRPLSLPMESIHFQYGSILQLPYDDNSVYSLSSICVIEHIGLGRYGDHLDWYGTEKAIAELKRVLAPSGDLYISLPLDDENRIYFNAHRALQETYLESLLQPLTIVDKWYICGHSFQRSPEAGFRIGCYHLRKRNQHGDA